MGPGVEEACPAPIIKDQGQQQDDREVTYRENPQTHSAGRVFDQKINDNACHEYFDQKEA